MKQTIYIIALFFLTSCQTQDDNKHTGLVINREEQSIMYDFSSKIKERNDGAKNGHSIAEIATLYSNIGEYFSALKAYDQDNEPNTNSFIVFDSSYYHVVPAIDFIIKESSKNQIVIINESHHIPYHRFFTMLLLKKLSEQGFTYFGAETLNLLDSSLTKTNYPTINSGYYSVEPQYGNLIREALKTGFNIFAYEPNEQLDEVQREIQQAKNIQKILIQNPKAKIVIHCGYDHILEGEIPGFGRAMAGRLNEYTGINPLTIDQVELTEHSDKKYENPFYDKFKYDNFVVPLTKGEIMPVPFRLRGIPSDIFVYHPRTHLKYNRPHWLFEYYTPKFINNEITISFPVLVKAYISNENEKSAVPIDVIEIKNKIDTIALALIPKTSYKILIENKQKQKQTLNIDIN